MLGSHVLLTGFLTKQATETGRLPGHTTCLPSEEARSDIGGIFSALFFTCKPPNREAVNIVLKVVGFMFALPLLWDIGTG